MKLFIDIGNTAMKSRYRRSGSVVEGGCRHGRDWRSVVTTLLAGAPGEGGLTSIWVASVAGREADAEVAGLLQVATGIQPQFYYSRQSHHGVTSCYPDPVRLGVDRWVAMIEGFRSFGACIIVDCGSALTIDAVDARGRFMGGYIVRGWACCVAHCSVTRLMCILSLGRRHWVWGSQLVEQLTCNQPVGGSTPLASSIFLKSLPLYVNVPAFETLTENWVYLFIRARGQRDVRQMRLFSRRGSRVAKGIRL